MVVDSFFPERSQRGILDFVQTEFPSPLAMTYARLHEEMDKQEPIAAAWQLRDAFECFLRFTASLGIADCLQAGVDSHTESEIACLLLKPQGLTVGDWHRLLVLSLRPVQPAANSKLAGSNNRSLPQLVNVFFRSRRRPTPLSAKISGGPDSFINWRNRVFGHGVFKQDRVWYAGETLRWLTTLHELYLALQPVLSGWRLVGAAPDGHEVAWQGADHYQVGIPHTHEAKSRDPRISIRAT